MTKSFLLSALLAACAIFNVAAQQDGWAPAGDKIKTQWASRISTCDGGWNVYPRPLLVRGQWQNLNGLWDYAITSGDAAAPSNYDGKILVPYCVESSLSGVGKSLSKSQVLTYRRTFTVPKSWLKGDGRVMLNFGAVDWDATVYVNGQRLGRHTGGYTPFSIDVTPALKRGENEVKVEVRDATNDGYQPCGKQRIKAKGIWYTPVSGIWQTVWLEPVPRVSVSNLVIVPDVDRNVVNVTVQEAGGSAAGVLVKVLDGKRVIAQGSGAAGDTVAVKLPAGTKLWSPDSPYLYNLEISLKSGGKAVDKVKSYFAMRKFSTARDADGIWRLQLNGKNIFEFGLLDQGWWPDGLYTAPGYEAMCYDIDKTKQWGYNLIRKHVKVEPAVWYNYCDKMGLIVWQDMPSGDYKNGQPWQYSSGYYRDYASHRSAESEANYYKEWGEIIDNLRSYPCISTWIPFNEAWGQFKTWSVVKWTRERDPYHLINPASGGNFYACGDMLDLHHYPEPKMFMHEPDRVVVLGEYGGLGLPLEGHTWIKSDRNWGYVKFKNSTELTNRYIVLTDTLRQLARKGFAAAIYTQTTDCETEVNGIMTYDRAVVKMQEDRFGAANRAVVSCLDATP